MSTKICLVIVSLVKNRRIESHTLLRGVSECLSVLSTFIVRFW
jgi:hypothetical protein